VNNAHHLSRAGGVSALADGLHARLQAHAATWSHLEAELDSLPAVTEKLWTCNADIEKICALMSETEEVLLEVGGGGTRTTLIYMRYTCCMLKLPPLFECECPPKKEKSARFFKPLPTFNNYDDN
jgi:hypothetical protein